MFWSDKQLTKKRHARIKMPPPVPETGWTPPKEFPNLSAASVLSFDVETKEFDFENGPGWARGQSHIVGFSIAAKDRMGNRGSWYFPLRHEIETEHNMDVNQCLRFAHDTLSREDVPKVGANITYDIGTFRCEGVHVKGPLYDPQFAEPLIDSEARVSLDTLAHKYLGHGKITDYLKDWCQEAYPNTPVTKWRSDIYRAPPRLVGFYGEGDAWQPIEIMEKQLPILHREGTYDVFRLECDIIPLMIEMRLAGVRVDVDRAYSILHELEEETKKEYKSIYEDTGFNLQSTDSRQLAKLFDTLRLDYPRTAEGNPSITKPFLSELEHPIGQRINDLREYEKMCGTFLKGYIIDKNINGRVHCEFHQLKGDENGTIVGRFSSSNFNLQNIPSRSKLGKRIRECFTHDEGHAYYCKMDYSQIHYRILAHYAVGPGSDELRASYCENPKMDYHGKVYNEVGTILDWDLENEELREYRRRPIKNVNFGLLYGQSINSLKSKTAMYFGDSFSAADIEVFFNAYFDGAPYVKPTMKAIAEEVQRNGYVTTLRGRRIRFHLFEPATYGVRGDPLPYHAALDKYGPNIRYAFDYRGVNYKFQGSEPDIMKTGMLKCYQSGVFDYTGYPRLTCHDELGFSVPNDSPEMREAFEFIKHTMENAVPLRVPVLVDMSFAENWGQAK